MLMQTLDILQAQNTKTISSSYSTLGRVCNAFESREFLENLNENKFFTELLLEACQIGEVVETSRDKISDDVVRFICLNSPCSVIIPDHQLRFIQGEWSADKDEVLTIRGHIGDQCCVNSTNLSIGGPLILKSGWLVYNLSTDVEESIGRDGKSYSGKSTITGAWSLDRSKITRLRL